MVKVNIVQSGGVEINAPSLSDLNFSIAKEIVLRQVSGDLFEEGVLVDDRIVDRFTSSQINSEAEINVTPITGEVFGNIKFVSQNEAIATVDETGKVGRVSDGSVGIEARVGKLRKRVPVDLFISEGGVTTEELAGWKNGTAAESIENDVLSRINASSNPSQNIKLFSTRNHGSPYVRNPNIWLDDVDITGVCVWNSQQGHKKKCTMITPRHYIFSKHYGQYPTGTTVEFVDNSNNTVTMTVTGEHVQPAANPVYSDNQPDLWIGSFTQDVPAGISPVKILPENWRDYVPTCADNNIPWPLKMIPNVAVNQDDWAMLSFGPPGSRHYSTNWPDLYSSYLSWYGRDARSGDSGGPIMYVFGDELLLSGTFTFPTGGPKIANYISEINAAIAAVDAANSVSTGYTVTEGDFSFMEDFS